MGNKSINSFESKIPIKLLIYRIFILIIFSSFIGLIFNLIYPQGINPFNPEFEKHSLSEYKYISVSNIMKEYESNVVVFIDNRSKEDYDLGHIPGAFNLNVEAFSNGKPETLEFIPIEVNLILYSNSHIENDSERVVALLKNYNYKNIFIFREGWQGWKQKDYPIEK